MNRYGIRALGALGAFAAAPAFAAPIVYTFDSGAQGWTAANTGITGFAASGGALTFNYVAFTPFDPIIDAPGGLGVNGAAEHWLRFDIEITTPAAAPDQLIQVFFNNGGGYNEPDSRTFTVTPNAGVQTVIFDMAAPQGGRDPFDGTITDFRIDPGTSEADLVGGSARIELIALTHDADFDGIADDVEIDVFGDITTADGTSDFDGDGISDSLEISLGLDPFTDEGASVPLGGTLLALLGLGAAGIGYARRRK